MIVFRLDTGTAGERRVVRRALKDLLLISGRALVARKRGPNCRRIVISDAAFPASDEQLAGYHLKGPRSNVIAIRPGLNDSTLYTVFLHELGHFFGLEHRTTGLMQTHPEARSWGKLTPTLRQRVAGELAHLIVARCTRILH